VPSSRFAKRFENLRIGAITFDFVDFVQADVNHRKLQCNARQFVPVSVDACLAQHSLYT
jgi:hypothetical protein